MKCSERRLLVSTFIGDSLPGSIQYLHFLSTLADWEQFAQNFVVDDEFDHSFVYLESASTVKVQWKNRAGTVQFCGSGAYALAWALFQEYQVPTFLIDPLTHSMLEAQKKSDGIFLKLAAQSVKMLERGKEGSIYCHEGSGIFIVQLNDVNLLKDDKTIEQYQATFEERFLGSIHGLCAFVWGPSGGQLRYFTPWHGRPEDYVTGSIHQYLSPLVAKLYGRRHQEWVQLYKNGGGRLTTSFSENHVLLSGKCKGEKCYSNHELSKIPSGRTPGQKR